MARPLRIEYPGAWYHVMNRGRRKERIFFDDSDYRKFLSLIGKCFDLFELETCAYSLMPNHYHLLVRTPRSNLSRCMRHLDGVFTQYINKKYLLDGSVFRGRFKSILVEKETYLLNLVRYIHRNPLEAGLEQDFGNHLWTSHRPYLNERDAFKWLKMDFVLKHFGTNRFEAKKSLNGFVKAESSQTQENLRKILDRKRWPPILGSQPFRVRIKKDFLGDSMPLKDVTQSVQARQTATLETIQQAVAKVSGVPLLTMMKIKRGTVNANANMAKRAFIFISREHYKYRPSEIRSKISNLSLQAISKQYKVAHAEMEGKKGCFWIVTTTRASLEA
jgi:putative transposase